MYETDIFIDFSAVLTYYSVCWHVICQSVEVSVHLFFCDCIERVVFYTLYSYVLSIS